MLERVPRFNVRKRVFASVPDADAVLADLNEPVTKASLTFRPGADDKLAPAEPECSIRQRPRTIEGALEYLDTRILSRRAGGFDKLLYLASFRDLTSGVYVDNSLTTVFGPELAAEAMTRAHRIVFHRILDAPFAVTIEEFRTYLAQLPVPAEPVIRTWRNLRICRTLIPNDAESREVVLFECLMDVVLGASEGQA
jgi:hypothetical protein